MKKLLNIILFAGVTLTLVNCEEVDDDFDIGATTLPGYVEFVDSDTVSVTEGESYDVEVTLPVSLEENVTVTYQIIAGDASTDGVDFNVEATNGTVSGTSGSETIVYVDSLEDADVATIRVNLPSDDVVDGDKYVTLRLLTATTASGEELSVGLPSLNTETTLLIKDSDCVPPSLVGTYSVVNRETSPAGCGDPANDGAYRYKATVTLVSEDGPDQYTYQISDVTGGLYANCYGDGENPGNIETDGFTVNLVDQPDVVYGGDAFNGTGKISCDNSFTLTFENTYGDKGTSYYTKID